MTVPVRHDSAALQVLLPVSRPAFVTKLWPRCVAVAATTFSPSIKPDLRSYSNNVAVTIGHSLYSPDPFHFGYSLLMGRR